MIEGQKDSQAGEVDKGGERTPWFKKEELTKKERWGIQKWDSSGINRAGEWNWL